MPERLVVDDLVAAADDDDRAGQFVSCDGGLDERRDRRETGARLDRGRRAFARRSRTADEQGRQRQRATRGCFTEFNIY